MTVVRAHATQQEPFVPLMIMMFSSVNWTMDSAIVCLMSSDYSATLARYGRMNKVSSR